jgi:opacity protein-like surface antigen
MRRVIAIVVLGASVLLAAAAVDAATWQAGIKGGVAIQKLSGDDVGSDQVDNRTGFVGGAYFQSDVSKSFGVRLETLYFMKGASTELDTLGLQVKGTLKLDYIEFPLLAVAKIPMSETATLSFFGGPTFAFNTKADAEITAFGTSASQDVGDQVNSFDFGLTFGAGVSFNAGSALIGIDGRYGFGLSNVPDSNDPQVITGDDVKNKGFAIMASVGMPIGQK